jgi:hypothetical protein
MTYNQAVEQYTKELQNITNKIKTEMDLFYEQNKDSDDIGYIFKRFRDIFDLKVGSFDYYYNMSCPKVLLNTPFANKCLSNSISVYLDLSKYYTLICDKFLEKFPPLDDSLEDEDLL